MHGMNVVLRVYQTRWKSNFGGATRWSQRQAFWPQSNQGYQGYNSSTNQLQINMIWLNDIDTDSY